MDYGRRVGALGFGFRKDPKSTSPNPNAWSRWLGKENAPSDVGRMVQAVSAARRVEFQ